MTTGQSAAEHRLPIGNVLACRWIKEESYFSQVGGSAGISATRLGGGSYWISGSYATPGSVLEVTGDGIAPMTVPFDGWEHGPPSLPHFLRVVSPLVAEGQVRTMDEDPVAGALVVVSASVPAPSGSLAEGEREAWRVIAEAVTDEDGAFRVLGLGPGEYEFRALHPNQGRVAVVRTLGAGSFVLRLRPPKLVIGRVVKRGLPASKIPIRVSPEPSQFTGTGNPWELVAADVVTDEEGRFAVASPHRGILSLIVGTPSAGIVRRSLGPVDTLSFRTDIGVIELPERLALFARLDGYGHCELSAAGPFGSIGVTMITAVRAGPGLYRFDVPESGRWILNLACGRQELLLDPPYVDLAPGDAEAVCNFARSRPIAELHAVATNS